MLGCPDYRGAPLLADCEKWGFFVGWLTLELQKPCNSETLPLPQLAPVSIQITTLSPQFAPFMTGSGIFAAAKIPAQFAAIVSDLGLVVANIATHAPTSVVA